MSKDNDELNDDEIRSMGSFGRWCLIVAFAITGAVWSNALIGKFIGYKVSVMRYDLFTKITETLSSWIQIIVDIFH